MTPTPQAVEAAKQEAWLSEVRGYAKRLRCYETANPATAADCIEALVTALIDAREAGRAEGAAEETERCASLIHNYAHDLNGMAESALRDNDPGHAANLRRSYQYLKEAVGRIRTRAPKPSKEGG